MLGSSGLVKHYVNLIPLIIIMCGGVAYKIIVDISKKEMSYRKIFVFFVVLFFVQILIFNNYFHKNPQASARSFMSENIDSDKLVVLDERMYTLFGYWIANDKNPVTLINFVRLNNFYKNSTNIIEDNVYLSDPLHSFYQVKTYLGFVKFRRWIKDFLTGFSLLQQGYTSESLCISGFSQHFQIFPRMQEF